MKVVNILSFLPHKSLVTTDKQAANKSAILQDTLGQMPSMEVG
jgi:hypothetical protein